MDARRGKLNSVVNRNKMTLDNADKYIGLQCLLFIVQHQLIFWVTFLIVILIFSSVLFPFVWSYLNFAIFFTLAVAFIRSTAAATAVKLFIADDIVIQDPLAVQRVEHRIFRDEHL